MLWHLIQGLIVYAFVASDIGYGWADHNSVIAAGAGIFVAYVLTVFANGLPQLGEAFRTMQFSRPMFDVVCGAGTIAWGSSCWCFT